MTPRVRAAHAARLEAQSAHLAITLVYNQPATNERITRDMRSLHARVDRILLGRRYHKRAPHERSQVWAVIEKINTYPHVHCGWRIPPGHSFFVLSKIMAGGIWLTMAPAGGYKMKIAGYGWADYATKHLQDSADIIESVDFLR